MLTRFQIKLFTYIIIFNMKFVYTALCIQFKFITISLDFHNQIP